MTENKTPAPAVSQSAEMVSLAADFKQRIDRDYDAMTHHLRSHGSDIWTAFNIESRAIGYANMEAAAKTDRLAKCPMGPNSTRIDVLRDVEPDLISPEAALKWAAIDIYELGSLPDRDPRFDDAATEIMQNIRRSPLYAAAMQDIAPDAVRVVAMIDEKLNQRIAAKEDFKAMEFDFPPGPQPVL